MTTRGGGACADGCAVWRRRPRSPGVWPHFEDEGPAPERICRFIAREAEHFPSPSLCRVCRVSRSAYYAWAKKGEGPSEADLDEAYLANASTTSGRRAGGATALPGSPPPCGKQGEQVNEKRVARLMGEIGIEGICGSNARSRRPGVTPPMPAADLVERDFSAERPDELWLTDLTYIATDEGWLYLCSILDVFSRRLLGWSHRRPPAHRAVHRRPRRRRHGARQRSLRRHGAAFGPRLSIHERGLQPAAAKPWASCSRWAPSAIVMTIA